MDSRNNMVFWMVFGCLLLFTARYNKAELSLPFQTRFVSHPVSEFQVLLLLGLYSISSVLAQ